MTHENFPYAHKGFSADLENYFRALYKIDPSIVNGFWTNLYVTADEYISGLNNQRIPGYNDWRLPAIQELMSLLEPEKQSDMVLEPLFTGWFS